VRAPTTPPTTIDHRKRLWTGGFQRSVAIGITSPKPHTESLMLSKRENGKLPNGGTLSAPASVPASEVLTTPYDPRTPTVAWPPKTGVAKV
jgi:hypothetical protein